MNGFRKAGWEEKDAAAVGKMDFQEKQYPRAGDEVKGT